MPASAAEIRIQHSVIKRILSEQVFTDEGRKYVKANRAAKCNYAYLENPEIGAANGQLRIRARFTARTAGDWFGRCIGFGDSFTAVIYATPYYTNGSIRLKGVRVDSEGADGFYVRRVRSALAQGLTADFSYRLYDDAKRILEEERPKAPYRQELRGFNVIQIRTQPNAIVLVLDFVLDVK